MDLKTLLSKYRNELLQNVIPFWVKHAIGHDGGINTCIQDDGSLVSRDRWNWSQWRALWVFSKLFTTLDPRYEWLDIAHGIYGQTTSHGPLENGHWPLLVNESGAVQRGYESLYTDGFAIYALVEYWRATGREEAIALARSTFDATQEAFRSEIFPPTFPYPIPQRCKSHGLSMLFSLAYFELASVTNEEQHWLQAIHHHELVMHQFLRPDRGLVLEWLNHDGSEHEPPIGTVVCPGHAIESMWFQIHIASTTKNQNAIRNAVNAIRSHLEAGWDTEYGGIFLAVDADGRKDVQWPHADKKLWWPHTEALYATLLALECSGEDWCLDWHKKVHDYSFERFPVLEHGEWRQKLDRYGQPVSETLVFPVKDPFHLPRALIYCIEVLTRLVKEEPAALPSKEVVSWP